MTFDINDLITPQTADEILDSLLSYASAIGLPTTSWQDALKVRSSIETHHSVNSGDVKRCQRDQVDGTEYAWRGRTQLPVSNRPRIGLIPCTCSRSLSP